MSIEKNETPVSKVRRALSEESLLLTDYERNEKLLRVYPWLAHLVAGGAGPKVSFLDDGCEVRILMVADDTLNYDKVRGNQFGLGLLTELFPPDLLPPLKFRITTAHRGNNEADLHNFKFDQVRLSDFHQIWLFGMKINSPITSEEIAAIAEFMDTGGVFATGDHQDLGVAMCGAVPRVRSMRLWDFSTAPSVSDERRHDTRREGRTPGFGVDDEEDDVPQIIHLKLTKDNGSLHPHYLFEMEGGKRIRALPDHMHEGECVVPDDAGLGGLLLPDDPSKGDEYPFIPQTQTRVEPRIVALSTSPSWFFPLEAEPPDVNPRCFGVIGAYDGSAADKGRVVVDASFHHFTNAQIAKLPPTGNPGLDFEAIKRYYHNIASWLLPEPLRLRRYLRLLVTLRYMYPLVEELLSFQNAKGDSFLEVGALTREAIAKFISPAEATECALCLIAEQGTKSIVSRLINPWSQISHPADKLYYLINSNVIRDAIIGDAMTTILNKLPNEPYAVRNKLAEIESEEGGLETVVINNVKQRVVDNLNLMLEQVSNRFSYLVDKFTLK